MLVVNLLLFINNSKFTLLQRGSKPLLSLCMCWWGGGQGGKGSFIEPISINKSFTLEGFSLTTGYLDKLLPKKCVVNTKIFIDQEIFNCWEKNRQDAVSRKIKMLLTLQFSAS